MAFDAATRNELQKLVGRARGLLVEEFMSQCQGVYGIQPDGSALEISSLGHLSEEDRNKAELLRDRVNHLAAGIAGSKKRAEAVARVVHEQAFTVLNRLSALRMCEERDLVQECVRSGYDSKGFRLYEQAANKLGGDTYSRYRLFLQLLFDELAIDLGVLFDRFSLHGMLFPRENALKELLQQINTPALTSIWAEDEAIGWVYQYFNSQDERQAMRKASAAPRNSRELAVRNQFFTPRYVVEFLTDNTLGRIWYEMRHGDTALKEACGYLVRRPSEIFLREEEPLPTNHDDETSLSVEERLDRPVYIAHREKKDPRDIRVLDPACGSGHFLLYAFDLLETIYQEAWEAPDSPESEATGSSLREDYSSSGELQKAIPELILRWNLYGVDIDPRAAQIAALSLWLRAQKAWQGQRLETAERPQIKKSNIVCAEPMPGEKDLLQDFTSRLKPAVLGQLVEVVFDRMQLAGEAGSLLRIEEEIQNTIETAKDQWLAGPKPEQEDLFPETAKPKQGEMQFDFTGVTRDSFWAKAENNILSSLKDYASEAQEKASLVRKLFSEDAAQGFSFIDLCRQRFDVVLMNPPFGLATQQVFRILEEQSPDTYVEIYASFVRRGIELCNNGYVGAITSRGYMNMSRLAKWRESDFIPRVSMLLDLGLGVMDSAYVESCAYILSSLPRNDALIALDCRESENCASESKCESWVSRDHIRQKKLFIVPRSELNALPEKKIVYSIDQKLLKLITGADHFENNGGIVRTGLTTFDDFRFLRLAWEVPKGKIGKKVFWEHFSKGGEYSKYYIDVHLVINRADQGAELAAVNMRKNGQVAQSRQGSKYYYKGGLTFTSRSAKGFTARILPSDCIISHNAPSVYPMGSISQAYLLGWINSRLIRSTLELYQNFGYYTPGSVKTLPWVSSSEIISSTISEKVKRLVTLYRKFSEHSEISPIFIGFLLGNDAEQSGIKHFLQNKKCQLNDAIVEIRKLQKEVSDSVDQVYGVNTSSISLDILGEDSDADVPVKIPSSREFGKLLFSYFVGVVFGRWSIKTLIHGHTDNEGVKIFEPVPICPPAMLVDDQGLPVKSPPPGYPVGFSPDGILVNSAGVGSASSSERDLLYQLRQTLRAISDNDAALMEAELCELLGVRSLRDYVSRPSAFFGDHLTLYSKSRRKAPIYWPLSTDSGSYTLWVYYPRLSDQTLYVCVNDYIDTKLNDIARDLKRLRAIEQVSVNQQNEIDTLVELERELKVMREELLRVAKLPYKPDRNDGVLITAAPLWSLLNHKSWKKDLKKCWEELEAGKYDWAHLAYAIWPDRVREVCRHDKSIAIAQGLEELYEG